MVVDGQGAAVIVCAWATRIIRPVGITPSRVYVWLMLFTGWLVCLPSRLLWSPHIRELTRSQRGAPAQTGERGCMMCLSVFECGPRSSVLACP